MKPFVLCSSFAALALTLGSCSGGAGIGQPAGTSNDVAASTKHTTHHVRALTRVHSNAVTGGIVVLHVYDTAGHHLNWGQFRAFEENGNGSEGDNDVLLDPATMRIITMWPLESTTDNSGDPMFSMPSQPTGLAFAWPTTDGYSNIIVNLPDAPGTYVYNLLAARQLVSDLDGAVAARPWYTKSTEFNTAYAAAHTLLDDANAATTESSQGAYGAQAMNAAVHAEVLLLSQSGLQYARAHYDGTGQPEWAVTVDTLTGGTSNLQTIANLYGTDGWLRLQFLEEEPPSYYASEVASAKKLGLHVVGQILDSSDWPDLSYAQWEARVQSYVQAFPNIDEWEVGNEANGNWLGTGVAQKINYAAAYVKAHTHARVLLTLYWYLGDDDAQHSMFTWAGANLNSSIMSHVDDLGISLYPEEEPMGSAFERVVTTLHNQYPAQRVMVTELDYWTDDGDHIWWWGSQSDPYHAGRIDVANYYQAALYSYPYAGGGSFWWNYVEEVLPQGSGLWNALHALHGQV
ncbi:MAG: hypothetical protein JO322_01905 [Candidatus Eremiobacteraeota bacterium]|nr:hypothetical protein [Candidatus Eremiobacteraeota bacterium]